MGLTGVVVYRIDREDTITSVNDEWVRFAEANDGAALADDKILGRPLWGYIADAATRLLYRDMLGRVRAGKAVSFRYRCDGPACRRQMEMQVVGLEGGAAEFRSRVVRADPRPSEPLLSLGAARSAERLCVCSWCNKIDGHGEWLEVEEAVRRLALFDSSPLPQLTHTICEVCTEQLVASTRG